ncbi:MAG: hypothetical protein PVG20_01340 [Thioalkalispiraceae bacterium]|jgi:hypothetical protein
MMKVKQQSRLIAGLLALAVFVTQSSVVFAALGQHDLSKRMGHHCMMNEIAPKGTAMKHTQSGQLPDCCKTSKCAENFCVPYANYLTSALFNSITLLHSSIYAHTMLDTSDQLPAGIEATPHYRPPRDIV